MGRYPVSEVILGTKCYGVEMSQTWEDLELYEKLLNHHRGLKSVVELGTGQGGFSLYLYYQCLRRGIKFATYDLVEPPVHVPGWQFMDVFAEHVVAREFIHPMLLI